MGVVDFFDTGEGVDFGDGLVFSDSQNSWEAEGEAAGVAGGAHDVIEGDFEDNEGLDSAEVAVVDEGVGFEEGGQGGDFLVGEAGVGFANVFEGLVGIVGVADGEGVIAEDVGAAAVTVFDAGDDYIQGGEFALELEPGEAGRPGW